MPQIQVLPAVPAFGGRLAQTLGEAAGDIGQGYYKGKAETALQNLMKGSQASTFETPNAEMAQKLGQQPAASTKIDPFELMKVHKLATTARGKDAADVLVKGIMEQQKLVSKEGQEIRKEQRQEVRQGIQKRVEATMGSRENINSQRRNLLSARASVETGDVGAFGRNAFADLFGEAGKRFKTASAAQLDAATKHLLIESLGEVSAKGTNLWLEKVAKSAAPELGKSEEANQTLITIALGNLDIKEKKLDVQDQLLSEYDQLGLKPPPNFEKTVDDLLKPYAKKIEEQVSYDTRVLYEKEKGERYLNNLEKVPKGTPLTIEKRDALIKKTMKDPSQPVSLATPDEKMKAKKVAEKLGYSIPSSDPNQRNQEPANVQ
jgi:hypothetical protein